MDKIKAKVRCCYGTVILLWTTMLNHISRARNITLELDSSNRAILEMSVSVFQTKISTVIQEYRIINWSFLYLILLTVLFLSLDRDIIHYTGGKPLRKDLGVESFDESAD